MDQGWERRAEGEVSRSCAQGVEGLGVDPVAERREVPGGRGGLTKRRRNPESFEHVLSDVFVVLAVPRSWFVCSSVFWVSSLSVRLLVSSAGSRFSFVSVSFFKCKVFLLFYCCAIFDALCVSF